MVRGGGGGTADCRSMTRMCLDNEKSFFILGKPHLPVLELGLGWFIRCERSRPEGIPDQNQVYRPFQVINWIYTVNLPRPVLRDNLPNHPVVLPRQQP